MTFELLSYEHNKNYCDFVLLGFNGWSLIDIHKEYRFCSVGLLFGLIEFNM